MLLLPLRLLITITLLFLFIHCSKFCKGVVININERENISFFGDVDDDESGLDTNLCCTTGNCTCHSFLHALVNLTDNVMINMTTDVVLSSVVPIVGIENITLFGYDSVTLHCNNSGGLKFTSCNNVTIIGILWEGCGTDSSSPALALYNSSMITVQYCTFQHSIGQALLLSNILKDVKISNCTFIHNNHHRGHGTAIHFLSRNSSQVILMIDGCNFTDNGKAESVVYFHGPNYNQNKSIYLHNCVFTNNRGISLHVMYHDILISGKIVFQENKGSSIFSLKSTVTFDENSCVNFHDNAATNGGAIYSDQSIILFKSNSNVTYIENSVVQFGGAVFSTDNSILLFKENCIVLFIKNYADLFGGAIHFQNNSTLLFMDDCNVIFANNHATESGGAIFFANNSIMSFEGNSRIKFADNHATINGGAINYAKNSIICFKGNSVTMFNNNYAMLVGGALHFIDNSIASFAGSATVVFSENYVSQFGGAIYSGYSSSVIFAENSAVKFINNSAMDLGGAILSFYYSDVLFQEYCVVVFTSNNSTGDGGAISSVYNCAISFGENSIAIFTKNNALRNGGVVHSVFRSTILFKGTTTVTFTANSAVHIGGTICSFYSSFVTFTGASSVKFVNNSAAVGGAISHTDSSDNISFQEQTVVEFTDNTAEVNCAAICFSSYRSPIALVFKGHSKVTFSFNKATNIGGAVQCSETPTKIMFLEHSVVTFTANSAKSGGAIYSNCFMLFTHDSKVTFIENSADSCGAVDAFDQTSFDDNCIVTFRNNVASYGGAVCNFGSSVTFGSNSRVIFDGNQAKRNGGVIVTTIASNTFSFKGNSIVWFINNHAAMFGGAIYASNKYGPRITLIADENSTLFFVNNSATSGGAIYFTTAHTVLKGHAVVTFSNNNVISNGGVIYCDYISDLRIEGNSNVNFSNNHALYGGVIYSNENNTITIDGNSSVKFFKNSAFSGGAIYSSYYSNVTFKANSVSTFTDNSAVQNGGAAYIISSSHIMTIGNPSITFQSNRAAQNGGAVYSIANSNILGEGRYSLLFANNTAKNGGAVFTSQCDIKFGDNGVVKFDDNFAVESGGAIYLSDQFIATFPNISSLILLNNIANGYGGAVYTEVGQGTILCSLCLPTRDHFHNNHARIAGNLLYISVPQSCNKSCLNENIIGISEDLQSSEFCNDIATTPNKIELYHPAICLDNNTKGECEIYYVSNIMLGQEIIINACILDYYNQPSNSVRFTISGEENPNLQTNGPHDILLSCDDDAFKGVSITGNKVSASSVNFSVIIRYHTDLFSYEKPFFIEVVVEISPCHPGFWYDKVLQKCTCYDNSNVVFCSDTNSTIKRGYWFGSVNGQPTVAVCPVNYCDFTCCETTDGFYHLSPLRKNQCRSHRSGRACGNCEPGWSLSFDSAECVKVEQCEVGQTTLVVVLIVIYWIVAVTAVFGLMYYKIGIGYLYVMSYYYSVLDILLNQTLYLSQFILGTFNTISSIFKITPQFLGQLCLVKDMSGIDQQFIHYIHPLAVTLILTLITLFARASYKFSSFISAGIIHVICLLLLLSYTSVTTTSLLLMRTLRFVEVDKSYTYLSPDFEYFRGRHLLYAIVAMLCIIVIVAGLPLLLLLEPFLNHKINFTKIKPLLDQFQGCYKDKYRCFAAYYMLCRIMIIVIAISTSPNDLLVQYILINICIIMATVHIMIKPYNHKFLNVFDGLVLQTIALVVVLPVFESSNSNLVMAFTFVLVMFPLTMFVVFMLLNCKENIKKVLKHKCCKNSEDMSNNAGIPTDSCVAVKKDAKGRATK